MRESNFSRKQAWNHFKRKGVILLGHQDYIAEKLSENNA